MLGKNHIAANVCSLAILANGMLAMESMATGSVGEKLKAGIEAIGRFARGDTPLIPWLVAVPFLYIVGTLMPDADTDTSMMGRALHLPFEHRTWTHAVWFPLLIGLGCMSSPIVAWFLLGYVLHLAWDSVSKAGVCWFYPISRYRSYPNGAKVKERHVFWMYRTGQASEYIVIAVLVFLALLSSWGCWAAGGYTLLWDAIRV